MALADNAGVDNSLLSRMLCIVVAAGASFVPLAWVSVPASAYLLFWAPGRTLVQILRPLRNQPGWQWGAVAGSLMLMPVLLHWVWWLPNHRGAILAAVVAINAGLVLLAAVLGNPPSAASSLFESRRQRSAFAVLLAWVAVWVLLFYWIPVAGGRAVPSPSGDYIKHHALMWSLERYPLPLHNIFFAAQSDSPYYYYEQFHLLPVALRILAGGRVSYEFAFGAVAALVAVTVTSLVFLIARNVLHSTWAALLAAACASIVGAWDVVPAAIYSWRIGHPIIVLDAWCPVLWRTHNVMNSFVWCPQHVAAMGTLLLCGHWLATAPDRRWWLAIAPLAAASVFGSSAYMAVFCLPGAFLYFLSRWRQSLRLPRANPGRLGLAGLVIGALAAGLMGWRAWHYHVMNSRFGGGATLEWDRFPFAFLGRAVEPGVLANWMEAPWLVPIEFGLGVIAMLLVTGGFWRRLWDDHATRLLIIVAVLGVAALWTVRTGINRIDYAYRMGSMFALVLGAICTGALLDPAQVRVFARGWRKPVLIAGIVLGLPVGLYEPPLMAVRTLFQANEYEAYAGASRYLRQVCPPNAVVQPEPFFGVKLVQLMDRQAGVIDPADPHVNVFCPPDKELMRAALGDLESAFRTADGGEAHRLFAKWDVSHVVAGPRERKRYGDLSHLADPRWFEIVYDDGHARVYRLKEQGVVPSTATSGEPVPGLATEK